MTLRTRIVAAFIAICVLLLAAGYVIVSLEHTTALRQFDAQLRAMSRPAKAVAMKPGSAGAAKAQRQLDGYFVGIRSSDGVLRVVVPLAADQSAVPQLGKSPLGQKPSTVPTTGATVDTMRVLAVPTRDGREVVVGASLTDVEASSASLLRDLVLIGLVLLIVLGLILWWVLRLGLAPITAVTKAARSIKGGDLAERAPAFPAGTEAHDLSEAFNLLVDTNIRSEAKLRRFVADASHELRTPLATLSGYASLYSQGGLTSPGAVDDAMQRIRHEARRMTGLVEELLVLARVDAQTSVRRVPVELIGLVSGVAADFQVLEPRRPLALHLPDSAFVVGDPDQITQVLMILLDNARKYSPPESPIEINVETSDGKVRVAVRDRGPGLEAGELERVFDRFYRAPKNRAAVADGAGLGLAIAQTLIEAHGGSLGASSTVGVGSEFWFELALSDM